MNPDLWNREAGRLFGPVILGDMAPLLASVNPAQSEKPGLNQTPVGHSDVGASGDHGVRNHTPTNQRGEGGG